MLKRILHVLSGLDLGGISTWLVEALGKIDRSRFCFDFVAHNPGPHPLADEARSLGARVIQCPHSDRPWRYMTNFVKIIREFGPYDAIHAHCQFFSGFNLLAARMCGVPLRIAHSHSDFRSVRAREGVARQAYYQVMDRLIRRCANLGLAASAAAALDLFGPDWESDPSRLALYCGVDLDPFSRDYDRNVVRQELGIPLDARVVGHVGRFTEPKNHSFMLDIMACATSRDEKLRLCLVGDGDLFEATQARVKDLGLQGKVVFLGPRKDVARVMCGAMDAFLFPSLHEGLGLALVEAQAAGLPCVISETIPAEVIVAAPLVSRLDLSERAEFWAENLLHSLEAAVRLTREDALALARESPFTIEKSVSALEAVYDGVANCGAL